MWEIIQKRDICMQDMLKVGLKNGFINDGEGAEISAPLTQKVYSLSREIKRKHIFERLTSICLGREA